MRLNKIIISNFHCFQNETFELAKNITVLIGKNGSGKSSFIKSIKNALSIFFSSNPSWGTPTIVGSVSDLSVANLDSREIWHNNEMKPAEFVDIKVVANKVNYNNNTTDVFPCWSFHKSSGARAKLKSTYYKNAYLYFRKNYSDSDAWPLFAYYSDRYPHIDAKLSDSIKKMIDNDDILYRCWAYYHWDNESSCALIWQKRYMRIYNLYFKRMQTFMRLENKESDDAKQCEKDKDKYLKEINYILKYLKDFTSNTNENLSDTSNLLQISDLYVDGIEIPYLVARFSDGTNIRWDELPAGYERLFNIVFDIAYRSYILNNGEVEPQGVILIDELDLHLHPSMEQDVLLRLSTTFKNIQFIVSTHSPLVISNTSLGENGKILLFQHNQKGYNHTSISDQYGMDYDFILSAIMKTEPQNIKIQQLKSKYLRLMRRAKKEVAQQTLLSIKTLVTDERYEQIINELTNALNNELAE